MRTFEIVFWISLFIVFYTYIGYGIVLYILVKIKETFRKPIHYPMPPDAELPELTLFIAAYNEEDVVDEKMQNCLELDYPAEKLRIFWVTDGSNDHTNERLARWPQATVLHQPERQGKTAALNRGMKFVKTPLVIFTDANTHLNREALREIVHAFANPKVGCVAGEKRIAMQTKDNAASGGEGIYWKYESTLKALDSRLYSAVGAAGELFAVRSELFEDMRTDTLLDDFILSLRIVMRGIHHCLLRCRIRHRKWLGRYAGRGKAQDTHCRRRFAIHLAVAPVAEPFPIWLAQFPICVPSCPAVVHHSYLVIPIATPQRSVALHKRPTDVLRCHSGTANTVLPDGHLGIYPLTETHQEQVTLYSLLLPLHERQRNQRIPLPEQT